MLLDNRACLCHCCCPIDHTLNCCLVNSLVRVAVFGARPVKRVVQRELETRLAKALLRNEFGEEDTVVIDADEEGRGLRIYKAESSNGDGGQQADAQRAQQAVEARR